MMPAPHVPPDGRAATGRRTAATAIAPAAAALLLAGCAWLRPLPPRAVHARLAAVARTPAEMGLKLEPVDTGFRLYPVCLPASPGPAVLPFSRHHPAAPSQPVVAAEVNGRATLALIDTGAEASVVDPHGAMRLGVVPLRREVVDRPPAAGDLLRTTGRGLGQSFVQVTGMAEELRLGRAALRRVPLGILDAPFARRGRMGGQRVEMLVGADALRALGAVVVDFPGEAVRIGPSGFFAEDGVRVLAETTLVGGGALPSVRAEIGGIGERTVVIDTGGSFSLWLPPEWAATVPVTRASRGPPVRRGHGAGGSVSTMVVGDRTLTLGGVRFEGVETEIGLGRPAGVPPIPYALLGRGFLARYRVSIDFSKRTFILAQ